MMRLLPLAIVVALLPATACAQQPDTAQKADSIRADSIARARADSIARARADSVARARTDSIARARQDSIIRAETERVRREPPRIPYEPPPGDTSRPSELETAAAARSGPHWRWTAGFAYSTRFVDASDVQVSAPAGVVLGLGPAWWLTESVGGYLRARAGAASISWTRRPPGAPANESSLLFQVDLSGGLEWRTIVGADPRAIVLGAGAGLTWLFPDEREYPFNAMNSPSVAAEVEAAVQLVPDRSLYATVGAHSFWPNTDRTPSGDLAENMVHRLILGVRLGR